MAEERYTSALTGPEIDAALEDMAQHKSEAWAVGARNGVNVGASDEAWHNNAKYYAQNASSSASSAAASATRAESAIPPSTAGALFYDQAQTLTDEQKRQVYSNLSMNPTPAPNMVDNAWFLINQRGSDNYSTVGEFVFDRWKLSSGDVNWSSDGISANASTILLQQYEEARFVEGEYYRVSVLLSDGTRYSSRFAVDATYHYIGGNANPYFRLRFDVNGKLIRFQLLAASAGMVVRVLKIEKTYYSTLQLDVMPDYTAELLKCQRYLQVIKSRTAITHVCLAYFRSGSLWRTLVPLCTEMRDVPTVSISSGNASDLTIYTGGSSTANACSAFETVNANSLYAVAINLTNSNAPTTSGIGTFAIASSAALIISAEI